MKDQKEPQPPVQYYTPVPKHMHRFSAEAYNKKPHQNSANLGNVKKNVYNTKKTDDGVKLQRVVLAHSLL